MKRTFAIVVVALAICAPQTNAKVYSVSDCAPYNTRHTQFSCIDQDGGLVLLGAVGHTSAPTSGQLTIAGKGKVRDQSGHLYRLRQQGVRP